MIRMNDKHSTVLFRPKTIYYLKKSSRIDYDDPITPEETTIPIDLTRPSENPRFAKNYIIELKDLNLYYLTELQRNTDFDRLTTLLENE